jgi:protein transport protein SEC23
MIQPILYVYTPETPEPSPVHLDIDYMRDDNVLYLDAFFFICIWHGRNVCDWRDKGLHEDPEYENIKSMLESPQEIAQDTLSTRLPVSKYISCDSGNGQERYIKCTVNPSVSNSDSNSSIPEGFYTDDVSLKKFIDHLKKKVVSSQQI